MLQRKEIEWRRIRYGRLSVSRCWEEEKTGWRAKRKGDSRVDINRKEAEMCFADDFPFCLKVLVLLLKDCVVLLVLTDISCFHYTSKTQSAL